MAFARTNPPQHHPKNSGCEVPSGTTDIPGHARLGKAFETVDHEALHSAMERMNTLEKLKSCLETLEPSIEMGEELRIKALKPLERMLEMSR